VFIAGFRHRQRCPDCGWLFERGPGHWIGGSEINMFVTFWVASSVFLAINWFVGFSWISLVLAAAFTTGFALLIHRPCRSLYFAFDYLIDPEIDASHGGGDRGDDDARDSPPGPLPRPQAHGSPDSGLRTGGGPS
jgi:hypothetical protein